MIDIVNVILFPFDIIRYFVDVKEQTVYRLWILNFGKKFSWKNVAIDQSYGMKAKESLTFLCYNVYKQAYENSDGRNRFPKTAWTRNRENRETVMVFARNKLPDLVRYTFDKSWLYRWFKEPFCWVCQSRPASLSADSISFLVSPFRLSSFFRVASSLSLSRVHGVTHRRCPLLLAYLLLGA